MSRCVCTAIWIEPAVTGPTSANATGSSDPVKQWHRARTQNGSHGQLP